MAAKKKPATAAKRTAVKAVAPVEVVAPMSEHDGLITPERIAAANAVESQAIKPKSLAQLGRLTGMAVRWMEWIDGDVRRCVLRAQREEPISDDDVGLAVGSVSKLIQQIETLKSGLSDFREQLPGYKQIALLEFGGLYRRSYCEIAIEIIRPRLDFLRWVIYPQDQQKIDSVESKAGQANLKAFIIEKRMKEGWFSEWQFDRVDWAGLQEGIRGECQSPFFRAEKQKFSDLIRKCRCDITKDLLNCQFVGHHDGRELEEVNEEFRRENWHRFNGTDDQRAEQFNSMKRNARNYWKEFKPRS